jgi:hypothetical protein
MVTFYEKCGKKAEDMLQKIGKLLRYRAFLFAADL